MLSRMYPVFWHQTLLYNKRLAVFSALLTRGYAWVSSPVVCLGVFKLNKYGIPLKSVIYESQKRFSSIPAKNFLVNKTESVNMPPKTKKAASSKPAKPEKEAKSEKKGKASKKGGDASPKIASRASKRNVDKAVSYKEVAENVDEKASESNRPKAKVAVKAKKTKYQVDSGSEVTDESSEEADSDDDKPKKKRSPPKPRSAAEKKETAEPLAKKAKKEAEPEENKVDEEDEDESDANDVDTKAKAEPEKKTEPTKTSTNFDSIDFKSDKTTKDGKPWNLKISSWNICGVRAWMKKGALDFIKHEDPDVICLQETRCSESKLPPGAKVEGYHTYWLSGAKEGYAGVGLYSKVKPISVTYGLDIPEHDAEGRLITAEYEKFYLVSAYVPNAGRGLVTLPKRLKWDPDLRSYLKTLEEKKPVILCGDLNVSHQAIDLANPKTNVKSAGFTQEERDGFTELLKEGYVDTYRHLYPDKSGAYTYWTYMGNARSRNVGWRLDYFVLSEKLVPNLCDNVIRSEVFGSDHCPITLLLNV